MRTRLLTWQGSRLVAFSEMLGSSVEKELPFHDPILLPRDEAIFLLHTAAEIEHSLMVQYLYASFTLNKQHKIARDWSKTLLKIAKEEMGHLVTVQNLLRLIGGPLNFEREDTPFRSEFYPFPFTLEPLTIAQPAKLPDGGGTEEEIARCLEEAGSLNRYIAAEMPFLEVVEDLERSLVEAIIGSTQNVNRVGLLYARLIDLFSAPQNGQEGKHLSDGDFLNFVEGYQAKEEDWTFDGSGILIPPITTRGEAIEALREIAEQGEAPTIDGEGHSSHFRELLELYKAYAVSLEASESWSPHLPVPCNPSTLEFKRARAFEVTPISNVHARKWAQLFNVRYRLMFGVLQHHLLIDSNTQANIMWRNAFRDSALNEMHLLSAISDRIVERPLGEPDDPMRAGPTFELPYTLQLPDRDCDRIRAHLATIHSSASLVEDIKSSDPFLNDSDASVFEFIRSVDQELITKLTHGERIAMPESEGSNTSFERDIKPLFTDIDTAHMKGESGPTIPSFKRFDLTDYDEVKSRSQKILRRLEKPEGHPQLMPPDQRWPQADIDLFKKWIDEGHPE